ncbi:MAG: hypothetical protein AAF851_22880 [Myxococcota bacterium]
MQALWCGVFASDRPKLVKKVAALVLGYAGVDDVLGRGLPLLAKPQNGGEVAPDQGSFGTCGESKDLPVVLR